MCFCIANASGLFIWQCQTDQQRRFALKDKPDRFLPKLIRNKILPLHSPLFIILVMSTISGKSRGRTLFLHKGLNLIPWREDLFKLRGYQGGSERPSLEENCDAQSGSSVFSAFGLIREAWRTTRLHKNKRTQENMSVLRQVLGLILIILICFGVVWIGSSATMPSIPNWYASLRKPSWTPPNWLFSPVWTFLYLSMAVAAWLVWRRVGLLGAALPLALFGIQLGLNLAWSIIFFGLKNIGLAMVDIVLLWLAIAATTFAFWRVSVLAGWLFVPYLAWVTFAAVLNFSIWNMNR